MKRIILYVLCAAAAISAAAQDYAKHEFLLRGAGGGSTLRYDAKGLSTSMGLGGSAGVGYNFFFNAHIGVGTGVEFGLYNAKCNAAALSRQYAAFDAMNQENFTFLYSATDFEETQSAALLTIPILFTYQSSGKHVIYGSAGLRVGIPVMASFDQTTSGMTTQGLYPDFTYPFANIPEAGFSTAQGYKQSGDIDLSVSCMVSAEAGVKWRINDSWKLYTGLYIDYGLNNIQKTSDKQVVAYQQATPGLLAAHSVLNSSLTNSIHNMSFGVRIGIAFGKTAAATVPAAATNEPAATK